MKTKVPADPSKLRELGRALRRVGRSSGDNLARHAQLRLAILNSIHGGHWAEGDRLPPETDLATAAQLSIGTVQRALRDLTDEGVVRRQQGSGSFVASAPHRIDDVMHCRFLNDDGSGLLPVFSKVLGRRAAARKGPWQAHFPADARVVRLERLLNVNDEFDVFSRFYFDGGRFNGLAARPITELAGTNFKLLLTEEAPAPSGGVSQTMTLVAAPAEVAAHMGRTEGACVAKMEIVRHIAGSDTALYFQEMFIPATSRKLVLQPTA